MEKKLSTISYGFATEDSLRVTHEPVTREKELSSSDRKQIFQINQKAARFLSDNQASSSKFNPACRVSPATKETEILLKIVAVPDSGNQVLSVLNRLKYFIFLININFKGLNHIYKNIKLSFFT